MKITTFGLGCANCKKNHENVTIAAKNCGVDAPEKIDDLLEMVKFGIYTSPATMIDGEIVSMGTVLSVEKMEVLIKERM